MASKYQIASPGWYWRPAWASAPSISWRHLLFIAAATVGIAGRIICGWNSPLWFDETFSGVIASQGGVSGLLHWCLTELTGPAYYMPLWAWTLLAGNGDAALRLPSMVLSLAAPLLLFTRGHDDRDVRVFWAVLAMLWLPGLAIGSEARPYALLFFLGSVQAMTFLRLIAVPRLPAAFAWTGVSALIVLTNYYGVVSAGIQGLALVAIHRKAVLRLWPAAAPLVPMACWMSVHLPYVLGYATSHAAWYEKLPLGDAVKLPGVMFGGAVHGTIILGTIAATVMLGSVRGSASGAATAVPRARAATADRALAWCGVLAFATIFALAFIRPSFAVRYLTPTMPALLFGIAWWAARSIRRDVKPAAIVVAMMFMMAAGGIKFDLDHPTADVRHNFNLQQPSEWLMQRQPRRVIFFWDSATGAFSSTANLAEVAGFFFRRAGHPVAIDVARVGAGADPNRVIADLAGNDPDVGVMWLVTDAVAKSRYPRISAIDRRFECLNFSHDIVIVEACRRR